MRHKFVLGLLPLLGACVAAVPPPSTGTGPEPTNRVARPVPPPTQPAPSSGNFRAPRVMNLPGLEGVIGKDGDALQRLFGTARLDTREGDVRKLQFGGESCVLDVFLYPLRQGVKPTATYVDARRSSDGLDVDRAACVAALRR